MAQRISKVFDAYEQEKIDRSIDMLSNLLGEEGVIKVIEEALCTESVETETNQTLT